MSWLDDLLGREPQNEHVIDALQPAKLVKEGVFPSWMLDQGMTWVDPKGYGHRISLMSEAAVLWSIDYMLANATKLRRAWAFNNKAEYDESERPRQWMLQRTIMRALMRRLVKLGEKRPWD